MYPAVHAQKNPDKPAYVMAAGGEVVTYGQLNERSNQAAQLFRSHGLQPGDHIAFCMENNARYYELCWAAQRSGLYFTAISSRLTVPEVEYIVDDCQAQVFITSEAKAETAEGLVDRCPRVADRYMVGSPVRGYGSREDATASQPTAPLAEELEGAQMLYSSGTTGRPKGV
jgi:long-chain acyl-CoA synthetase